MIFSRSETVRKLIMITMLLAAWGLSAGLTLEEAKELALKKNPAYQAQLSSYQAAKWSSRAALGSLLPTLTGTGTYLYRDPATRLSGSSNLAMNHDSRSFGLNLTQPLFTGGRLWQAYRISRDGEEIARLALESKRLSLLAEVESKYLNVLLSRELLDISEKDLRSRRQNLEIARLRVETGTLSRPELLRIQSSVASGEVALIQARTALELSRQDLANSLSLQEWSELHPFDETAEMSRLAALRTWDAERIGRFTEQAVRTARQNNLSLRISGQSLSIAKRSYRLAKGSFLPTLALSLSRSFSEDGFDRYEFDGSNTLALTASVPLLPAWGNYSAARQAYHEMQQSQYEQADAAGGIELAVRSAALNLVSAVRQAEAARLALDYAQQSYDQLMERFRSNLLSTSDLLDAEIMLQAAQISHTNSFYACLKARSALLQLLGSADAGLLNTLTADEEQ